MKSRAFIFGLTIALSALAIPAVAQDTVFGVFPNYYYNWYRYMPTGISHDDAASCFYQAGVTYRIYKYAHDTSNARLPISDTFAREVAVEMHPDSSVKVIGISYPLKDEEFHIFRNGSLGQPYHRFNRFYPESDLVNYYNDLGINPADITVHCNVYDKNMNLVHSQSRSFMSSDTTRYIQLYHRPIYDYLNHDYHPNLWEPRFFPMTDVFFDSALYLTDTFYISKTMTFTDDTTIIIPGGIVTFEFHGYGGETRIIPWERRLYRDTLFTGTWQEEEYGWHVTCLFPIIERDGDTCPQVRDVQCFKGTSTQFFLRWASGVNHHDWQVSYGPAGTAPESGTILECNQRQTSLITVDPDSHYVAYVRARCRFARDEWGPWSDSVSIWLNQPTDAIEYAFPNIAVTLTPNPSADAVTVSADGTLLTLELRDLLGRTVLSQQPSANSATVDVSTLPAGTYILRLHTPQGVATKKLVVSR